MNVSLSVERRIFCEEEDYMNEEQLAYFKSRLTIQKNELELAIREGKEKVKEARVSQTDILDRSNSFSLVEQNIRDSKRAKQTIEQIEVALQRIEDGNFGYCVISGEEIGLNRLKAIPYTAFSIQALKGDC